MITIDNNIYTNLEDINITINEYPHDLKAEVIISEIKDSLNGNLDFFINLIGQFKRPFSKDITSSEITDFNYDTTQFLKVNISKDGLYDILPEGIFHQYNPDRQKGVLEEMTNSYKYNKEVEKDTRLFFSPFENELFLMYLNKEQVEKDLLLELNGAKPFDFFYDFWNIDRNLPTILVAKLIRLLPYTNQIVGNLELTRYCLSTLLNENVELQENGYKEQKNKEQEITLGQTKLGLNMILGDTYLDYSLYLNFKIGPIKNKNFMEYINGKVKKIINLFYEYFLPMEVDPKTIILLPESIEQFNLNQNPILGITTRI